MVLSMIFLGIACIALSSYLFLSAWNRLDSRYRPYLMLGDLCGCLSTIGITFILFTIMWG